MIDRVRECAEYFRQTPGFKRVMDQLLIRYRRNGHAAGVIRLENPSEQERDALCGLFGHAFLGDVKFKVQDFNMALQSSRFEGVDLKEVLEVYFQTTIHTNRELKDKKEQQFEQMLESAYKVARSCTCKKWLDEIKAKHKDRGYLLLIKEMSRDFQSTTTSVCKAVWAMDELEKRSKAMLRLAVFSAQATTDPHTLDSDTLCGQLFLHLLSMKLNRPYPAGAEERDEVYFESGILCDSISSNVTQVGLVLREQQIEHPAFKEFRQRNECSTLSLANLNNISSAASPSGKAYLIENQMLFSQLCDQAKDFHSPLICTSGQLQVAVLRLLDMLVTSGTTLYYAGDFDGGGISIAARLLARYPANLQLWHMTADDYELCKSDVSISENSRSLLKSADGTILEPIAILVQETGCTGYQELLLDKLLPDLLSSASVLPEPVPV